MAERQLHEDTHEDIMAYACRIYITNTHWTLSFLGASQANVTDSMLTQILQLRGGHVATFMVNLTI